MDAKKLMDSFEIENCLNLRFEGSGNPDRTVVFYYTTYACMQLKKSENIDIQEAEVAKTNSIPGLYVYNDIITEQEEKKLVNDIDTHQWTKLLNRRVQHYGYEFKYGTNNVDVDEKMGTLPDFVQFLVPSKFIYFWFIFVLQSCVCC